MEDEKDELSDDSENVVHAIPSFKNSVQRVATRNPSFFKRMLSFGPSKKIGILDNNDDDSEASSVSNGPSPAPAAQEDQGEEVVRKPVCNYFDPPMPNIGHPVKIDLLITRNKKAEAGLHTLMEIVNRDVKEAINGAGSIPVGKDIDRVTVGTEVSERMAKVRSTKDIDKRVKQNMNDIQKALNYRKSAIIMMNSNYSKKLVRKIEPIYVSEARTIMEHKDES